MEKCIDRCPFCNHRLTLVAVAEVEYRIYNLEDGGQTRADPVVGEWTDHGPDVACGGCGRQWYSLENEVRMNLNGDLVELIGEGE